MLTNFFIEVKRNLLEFYNFKINILFANLGYLILFWGLIEYIDQEPGISLILLFTWYCSIHGIDSTAFIIEDEISDRTLVNVVSSKLGLFSVLIIRNMVQFIVDLIKAATIFIFIIIVNNINISLTINIVIAVFIAILIMYLIGACLGSFALIFKRVSSLAFLIYYFALFFSGLVADVGIVSILFPFYFLQNIIIASFNNENLFVRYLLLLCLQLIVYLTLAFLLMKKNMRSMYRRGRILHV